MTKEEFLNTAWTSKTQVKKKNSVLIYPVLAVNFVDGDIEVAEDCFMDYSDCEIVTYDKPV